MFRKLIFSAGFLAIATAASAGPLSLSATGGWNGASAPGGVCADIDNQAGALQDEIRWGGGFLTSDPALIGTVPQPLVDAGYTTGGDACWYTDAAFGLDGVAAVSGYNFDPFDGTYQFPGGASPFALGTFQHVNNPIADAITAVNYTLSLTHNASNIGSPLDIDLGFLHNETDNNCSGAGCSDDIVTVIVPGTSTTFTVGSDAFQFTLLGFSPNGQPGTFSSVFSSAENHTNQTQLWAQVTPVPEPATLTLLGTGLFGAAAAARKRRRARLAKAL